MRTNRRLKSQASLAIVMAVAIISVSVSVLVSTITYNHYANQINVIDASQAFLLADSALEDTLLRLQQNVSYTGGTFSVPEGQASVTVTTVNSTTRNVAVATTNTPVKRQVSGTISITSQATPSVLPGVFGGEDVSLVKSSAKLIGNLWTNDNVVIDNSTVVQGNVYTAGGGNLTSTKVQNSGRIEDNPNTAEVEGNLYSIDRIRVQTNGYVQGDAISKTGVTLTSGGTVGTSQTQTNLVVSSIQIPVFHYSDMKSAAQSAGTYYTTPSQFLNYLALNGNTTSGGVYYIASTSDLTFATGSTYNLVGTIISEGNINVYSTTYNHTKSSSNYLPILVSKKNINFYDQSPCNCVANLTGTMFAEQSIDFKHDQYTGAQPYAIQLTGAVAAGDSVTIEDSTKVTVDTNMLLNIQGFNITALPPGPNIDNDVKVTNWQIN